MSIQYKILGRPGRDNAVYTWLNAGTRMHRFLFDCGENIFTTLSQGDVRSIDYMLFSHLHLDHIAGFDYYFRRNFDRQKPNYIWGPENTSAIIHNRLKGFTWNLVWQTPGEFIVSDISEDAVKTSRFVTSEGYADKHKIKYPFEFSSADDVIVLMDNEDFILRAVILNHNIPSAAYNITEKDSINISKHALDKSGLTPGSWLQSVRDLSIDDNNIINVDNKNFNLGELRKGLLLTRKGESISYLTDFILDDRSEELAVKLISNSDTVICESQYHNDEADLAKQNFHLTSRQAAFLAAESGIKKLILFHISERYYTEKSYNTLLEDARIIFPETYFPDTWKIDNHSLINFNKNKNYK
jgi:ribonuclease Z